MQIQISWLLKKPADLDLHCLLRQGMLSSAREGLTSPLRNICFCGEIRIFCGYCLQSGAMFDHILLQFRHFFQLESTDVLCFVVSSMKRYVVSTREKHFEALLMTKLVPTMYVFIKK